VPCDAQPDDAGIARPGPRPRGAGAVRDGEGVAGDGGSPAGEGGLTGTVPVPAPTGGGGGRDRDRRPPVESVGRAGGEPRRRLAHAPSALPGRHGPAPPRTAGVRHPARADASALATRPVRARVRVGSRDDSSTRDGSPRNAAHPPTRPRLRRPPRPGG